MKTNLTNNKKFNAGFSLIECIAALGLLSLTLAVVAGLTEASTKASGQANRQTGAWLALRSVQTMLQNPALVLPPTTQQSEEILKRYAFHVDGSLAMLGDPTAPWTVEIKSAAPVGWSSECLQSVRAEVRHTASGKLLASTLIQRCFTPNTDHVVASSTK